MNRTPEEKTCNAMEPDAINKPNKTCHDFKDAKPTKHRSLALLQKMQKALHYSITAAK